MKSEVSGRGLKLHGLLKEDMVIPALESQDREGVLKEIVRFIEIKNEALPAKNLQEKLLQREKLGSTAVGEGFAIPHCKIKGLVDPIVLLAVSKKGVHFESLDGKPTSVFFPVIISSDNPGLNLQILAAIAYVIRRSRNLVKKICRARTAAEMLAVIREEEERIT
jgi:PTS system nitrogen regulatory IIA component